MIFLEQFWINKHSLIFEILQTTLSLLGREFFFFVVLEKSARVYLFQDPREQSFYYLCYYDDHP